MREIGKGLVAMIFMLIVCKLAVKCGILAVGAGAGR